MHIRTRIAVVGVAVFGLVALAAVSASGRSSAGPTVTTEPSIAGVPLDGNTLNGSRGVWSGKAPITYTYAWVRCDEAGNSCAAISGATTTSYKLSSADLGSTVRFRVTAKNADGTTTADSNPTGVVSTQNGVPTSTKPPVISGMAEVGVNLHTTNGSWVGATPITFSYQWLRCDKQGNACRSISGATNADYKLVGADADRTVRSKVFGKNSKGKSPAYSDQTAVVLGAAGSSGNVVNVDSVPADQRLVVDQVVFDPNPVTSRNVPIEVRVRVKDTRGKLVQGAYVFLRSTPILTSTPTDAPTGSSGWVTYHVSPRADFPLKTGYNVQFYVKAYRHGEPTLAGIYGSRLVQVATKSP
jgi:hypothetical protein